MDGSLEPIADRRSGTDRRQTARVLSDESGQFPARHELRDKVCLLDSGELLIAGNRVDPHVMSYEDTLRRSGFKYTVRPVPLAELHQHYARSSATNRSTDSGEQISNRQQQILGLIGAAVHSNASDMHFVIGRKVTLLRNRVNGLLETVADMPSHDGIELAATIYQSMCDVAEPTFNRSKPQDGRLKQEFLEAAGLYGARIATRPTERGLLMVLRLLYNQGERVRTLDQLGYLPSQIAQITRLTQKKKGINIFSGPTGSGKSTSLQVLFGQLIENYEGKINALTVEDPPEYTIDGAVQTPLGTGRTWGEAIRNAMRLDPDVMMIGEMRDLESAQGAYQAAITGHGVWTTLHANDAATILQRLDDLGLDAGLYADPSITTGLINQSLAPTLCPHCKVSWADRPAEAYSEDLVQRVTTYCTPDTVSVRGPGCERCVFTGVGGRTVIAEVITPNLAFMRTFRKDGKAEAWNYWVKEMAGVTKIRHLRQRINEGRIDPTHGEKSIGLLDEDDNA